MRPQDITASFQQAERDFAGGRLDEARARLTAILPLVGEHPAVLHLLALVEKKAGRVEAADAAFRRALAGAPGDAQVRNNYANLLIAAGNLDGAQMQLDQALAAQPGFDDGRINRAIVLQKRGEPARAWVDIERVAAARPNDARVQSLAGSIARELHRFDEAAARFDRALQADPRRPTALAGRARIALDRGEGDAEARYDAALGASPGNADLLLGKAMAAESAGRTTAAIEALSAMVADRPFWVEGQAQFVRMLGEAAQDDPFAAYRSAARQTDAPIELTRGYLIALLQAERRQEIADHVATLPPDALADPVVAVVRAAAASALDMPDADARVEHASRLPGGDAIAARHWLRRGEPDRVAAFLEPAARADPNDIALSAYLGIAWRLMGDPRADWLYRQPGLCGTVELGASVADLAEMLRGLHHARARPIGQSMRGGTQTRDNLLARMEPPLRDLRRRLDEAVAVHVAALPSADPIHPLLRHRDAALRITGSWSVRLTQSGYHVHHIHPEGVLSSALYVALPDWRGEADARAGWLELGRPPEDLGLSLDPIDSIEPAVGRLALFPSYMFHGTRPFTAGERLTVAFDVGRSR